MEKPELAKPSSSNVKEEKENEFQEWLLSLPKERNKEGTIHFYLYQGFWFPDRSIKPIISFQHHFQAHHSDLILASTPKSGTTWLKALMFSIVNRSHYTLKDSALLTTSPHDLVPSLEFDLYFKSQCPNLEEIPHPRMFSTHVPYASFPCSIKDSNCRIVYVCRNPLDLLVSLRHFLLQLPDLKMDSLLMDEGFEMFCRGVYGFGPFWDHVLGFWKASLERPDKVLFLKYEDMKGDIISHTKRLAEFLGFPFSLEEEKQGVVEEISRLCSLESLKSLEANKNGKRTSGFPNSSFFREGKVGDWHNYLTPLQAKHMEKLTEEKLCGTGLSFRVSCQVQKDDGS